MSAAHSSGASRHGAARQGNTVTEQSAPARVGGVEVRSIDYGPLNERHGKLSDLGPLWFMSNAQIATLAVGLVSITGGGNVLWSLIAIVSGTLIGTFFMAFHSAQGPQLGLPQMIQSRPQFGYVGALLVWLFAYLQYAGFNIFNTVLASQALNTTIHGGQTFWIVVVTVVALVVALVGYDFIHGFERYLTYGFLLIFGVFTVGALVTLHFPAGAFSLSGFSWTPFLAQFGVVAGYQISWAIYVSDYSRYLPPDVTVRKTFYWTYWGSALGAIWLMCLGTLLAGAVSAGGSFDTIAAIKTVGNGIFPGFGAIVLIFASLGLISVTALNMCGGSLPLISAIDSVRKVRPTLSVRIVTITFTAVLSLLGALAASENFLANFENFLLLVLYLFIPWTAVNLVDYFIVRRGHYAIAEIFNPHGMYGRWGWRGIVSYLVGFLAMVPFFSTGLYTGPVADALGGADLSIFIGLPVAGVLYWALARSIDVESETRIAMAEAAELEEEPRRHEAIAPTGPRHRDATPARPLRDRPPRRATAQRRGLLPRPGRALAAADRGRRRRPGCGRRAARRAGPRRGRRGRPRAGGGESGRAAGGPARSGEGPGGRRGDDHHPRLAAARRRSARRAGRPGAGAAAGRRRHRRRQDEPARERVRGLHRQPGLRADAQPLGPGMVARRIERRLRRRTVGRHGADRDRHGRRWVGADPSGVLRARGAQAVERHRGPLPGAVVDRPVDGRADGPLRPRRRPAARRDQGASPGGHQRPAAVETRTAAGPHPAAGRPPHGRLGPAGPGVAPCV